MVSDFSPCRMCGKLPLVHCDGLMVRATHCGCEVEAFTEAEAANKWNRLNPVEVRCVNDKEAK